MKIFSLLLLTLSLSVPAFAAGLELSTSYPGISARAGETLTFSLDLTNSSGSGCTVTLTEASAPEGWEGYISGGGKRITEVHVPTGTDTASAMLQLTIPADTQDGTYQVLLQSKVGGSVTDTLPITLEVNELTVSQGDFSSEYPEQEGASGTTFTYNATLINNSSEAQTYSLSSGAPAGWQVSFKPSGESTQVASIELENGPLQINRDATKRRVVIGVNVRDADIQQVVNQIRESLDKNVKLKPGYYFEYGGQFENLQNAISTLTVVIPIALMLILLLLFFAFHSITYSLVVFSTVPLSLIGGIVALWLRGLPFSISAGVGFIALFGVAVLNGILMINHFNDIRKRSQYSLTTSRIIAEGCPHLLRPVFLTGLVASLGFVPMAIAKSAGAEVQRPLATVVIGGLIVSTSLTLIIIPAFYRIVSILAAKRLRRKSRRSLRKAALGLALLIAFVPAAQAQQTVTMEQAIEMAQSNNPRLKMAESEISLARVTKGEAWDGGSTSFSYSWGQLNGESNKDNELSIEQSLGSLLTPFYKNALANTQISKGESYRDMVKKEITAEVKRAWAYYQYAYHVDALYRGQKELAEQLRNSGEQRYQQGDIDLAERNMITALATDLHTRWMEASEELNLAERRFAWTCYSDEALLPADTSLAVMQIQTDGLSLSSRHLDYFSAQVQEKRDMLKIERSRFFPEISVGYVRQKIAPLSGLNSWMVGVSFPILFFPQQSRAKQARINLQIANWQAEDNRRQLSNRVSELQNQLVRQRERLLYYQQAAVKEAEALQNSAVKKFQENETDISEFIQSLNAAREIRRGYIETVYAYNITVLELELYTE